MNQDSVSISAKLSELLASRAASSKPFPLRELLCLYRNNYSILYPNYMEGFRLFVRWLAPIAIPSYPKFKVPDLCLSYSMVEIAAILGTSPSTIYLTLMDMEHGPEIKESIILQQFDTA